MRSYVVRRPLAAVRSIRLGLRTEGPIRDRVSLAVTLGRLHVLGIRNRISPIRRPVAGLGVTFHFGNYDDFLRTFDEVFARASYAVQLDVASPAIIDCGANIGLSVLYFKRRFPNASVTAFEAEESNFRILSANLAANRLTVTESHRVALGGKDGTAQFYGEPNNPGSVVGTLGKQHARSRLVPIAEVPVRRLSIYVTSRVDLLKLDVEGSEGAVLTDLATSGKLALVDKMIIEYHHHLGNEQLSLAQVLMLVEEGGFDVQVATPGIDSPLGNGFFEDVLIYAYRANPDNS
jgi:FkbM family methyltransferase